MDRRKTSSSQLVTSTYLCLSCGLIRSITVNKSIDIEYDLYSNENIYAIEPVTVSSTADIRCELCDSYQHKMIQVDGNIIFYIKLLNKKGYFTSCCCGGHENRSNAFIGFKAGIVLPNLPDGWYNDDGNTYTIYTEMPSCNDERVNSKMAKHVIIRTDRPINDKSFSNWCDKLPAINENIDPADYSPFSDMVKSSTIFIEYSDSKTYTPHIID